MPHMLTFFIIAEPVLGFEGLLDLLVNSLGISKFEASESSTFELNL